MRILLIGATGQVGWELARTLNLSGEIIATSRSADTPIQLDTSDLDRVRATLDDVSPDLIVNASAYTAVDKAESDIDMAMRLNSEVPGVLGEWAAQRGATVIHYSTDYVFDGSKSGPYAESDPTGPTGAYGRSKLAGDQALLDSGANAIILRVSWVYGARGGNFLLTMRRLMTERDELRIVDDQIGAPTWCRSIAQATSTIVGKLPVDKEERSALNGVYHFSPSGSTSWFGFASAIRDQLGLQCTLHPIPSSEYPTPAKRPLNSRMSTTKLVQTFGLHLPSWENDLALCVEELTQPG